MADLTKSGNLFSRIFGGGPKVESLPLHLFGKLPIYKDFISCGLTDDPSKELRDWLSNGFSHRWSTREEYKGADIPLHTFLLHLPETKRFAAGALWGSEDEGGLRRFPFTLFTILPTGGRIADPLSAADYLSQFEQKALEIKKRVQNGMSLSSFYQAYRGIKLDLVVKSPKDVEAGLRANLDGTPVSTFARSLFGDEEAPDRWPGLLKGLSEHAGTGGAAAVRIPLGERLPAGQQLQFWYLWLRAQGRSAEVCGLLSQRAGPFARAVLFFRDLRPDDVLLLHPERSDYDFVEELAPVAPPPVVTGATPLTPLREEEIPTASGGAASDPPDPLSGERSLPAGWGAPLLGLVPAG